MGIGLFGAHHKLAGTPRERNPQEATMFTGAGQAVGWTKDAEGVGGPKYKNALDYRMPKHEPTSPGVKKTYPRDDVRFSGQGDTYVHRDDKEAHPISNLLSLYDKQSTDANAPIPVMSQDNNTETFEKVNNWVSTHFPSYAHIQKTPNEVRQAIERARSFRLKEYLSDPFSHLMPMDASPERRIGKEKGQMARLETAAAAQSGQAG